MKDFIRWFALLVVIVIAGSGLYYQYQNTRPCEHPILYAIGAVDARFSITNSALLKQAKAAAEIWNAAEGKTLFKYDPEAALKINLIYDARQANAKLGVRITERQAESDSARASLDAAKEQLVAAESAYNQEVSVINARGGATKSEIVQLASERAALKSLQDSIDIRIVAFNSSLEALNTVIAEFNKTTGTFFEEGKYVRDAAGERIDVFEFVGAIQLERVLAHELGHALGLEHNDDPEAIMYAKNESGNLVPAPVDLSALRALCGA